MAARGRLEHEHAAGDGVGAPAGQVGERGVRAVGVVGVVGAHLRSARRHDQPLAREESRDRCPPGGREVGLLARLRRDIRPLRPVAGDVLPEGVGDRCGRAVRGRAGSRRGRLVLGLCHTSIVHPPALRGGAQDDGASVATMGRWSLPAPSSVPMTRMATTFQADVNITWSIWAPSSSGSSVGQRSDGCRVRGEARVGAFAEVRAGLGRQGVEFVERRVEVARP